MLILITFNLGVKVKDIPDLLESYSMYVRKEWLKSSYSEIPTFFLRWKDIDFRLCLSCMIKFQEYLSKNRNRTYNFPTEERITIRKSK